MTILAINQLSKEQTEQVSELIGVCRSYDKLKGDICLSSELNFNQQMKCFFLLYDEGKLISFLSLFAPDASEAEISAFTLPEYRQKGYFAQLLHAANEELKRFNVQEVLFVQEPCSAQAKKVLQKLGATLAHSEYLMSYTQGILKDSGSGMKLVLAEEKHVEQIIALNFEIFDEKTMLMSESMVKKCMESPKIDYYVAIVQDEIVGIFNVNFENEEVSIFGLGIAPKHQGKGYGKDMLLLAVQELKNRGFEKISLEVNSINDKAFHLYQKYGFEVRAQFDYYRLAV